MTNISEILQSIFLGSDTWLIEVSLDFFKDSKLLKGLTTHELSCLKTLDKPNIFYVSFYENFTIFLHICMVFLYVFIG